MHSFEKLNVFLGDHHKKFICRRCLISYTNENALVHHKKDVEMIIYVVLELDLNLIFIGRNIS